MPVDLNQAKELFLAALEMSGAERASYLAAACAGDEALRRRVDAMLNTHENSGELLSRSPAEMLADSGATDAGATGDFSPRLGSTLADDETGGGPEDLSFLAPADKPGQLGRLAHYEVQEVLGKGGFGVVLKGFDTRLHRVVAIKVLSPAYAANGAARKRFIREARAFAAVKNEHVVAIYDVQEDAQPPYLVMELIDGISLQGKLDKDGPLGVKEILRIGMQVAEGLAAAHKQGLVHRDVKPANILLENGVERVKITDFGLARSVDDASVTQLGTVAGTPMYMSPEQAEGLPFDHRSDLFSLGTVLYAMCTGNPPFRGSGTHAVLKRVIEASARPIRESNNEIPEWLCDIIAKLHAKKPEERFQTAKEVAELLGERLADAQAGRTFRAASVNERIEAPAMASPVRPLPRHGSLSWRRIAAVVAALPFLALGGYAIWLLTFSGGSDSGHRDPLPNPNLVLTRDDPDIRLSVHPEQGGQHGFTFDGLETKTSLPPGRYHVQGRTKNDILVFQQWVTLEADKPQVVHVNSGWVQLFNGKDLAGWWSTEPDKWKVEDGVIVGSRGGHLLSHEAFQDFHCRIKAKYVAVGASTCFRVVPEVYEEVAFGKNDRAPVTTGALHFYEKGKGNWVAPWNKDLVALGEWFDLDIIARGKRVVVKVNGTTTADTSVERLPLRGGITFNAHGSGAGAVLYVSKIEIKELPSAEPAWTQLFNGKDYTGWKLSGAPWPVAGTGEINADHALHIETDEPAPAEFQLRLDAKLANGQTDISFHVNDRNGWRLNLTEDSAGVNATLFSNFGGAALKKTGIAKDVVKLGEWFRVDILARKQNAEIRINGTNVLELPDEAFPALPGKVAITLSPLQPEARAPQAWFRKIELMELSPAEPGWTRLFNGTDLTGWKLHPAQPGDWCVEKGILVGRGPKISHLFSERGDYENFHLRFKAKVNAYGDSGVIFRAPFAIEPKANGPLGYEAQIAGRTGTVLVGQEVQGSPAGILPDTWFTGEVIATDNRIVVRINGKTTANFADPKRAYRKGHLALQVWVPSTVVHFEKIEIKELPATAPPPLAAAPFDAKKAKEHQDAWAKHLGVPVEIENSIGMKLRLIPPGEFLMGSSAAEINRLLAATLPDWGKTNIRSEAPQKRVTIAEPYYFGAHEVTVGQFRKFVTASGYVTDAEASGKGGRTWNDSIRKFEHRPELVWKNPKYAADDAKPVVLITLKDAQAFCRWLSEQDGRQYVVPDEARWEYACRAGTTTPWSWGDDGAQARDFAWLDGLLHRVGEKAPNPFGLFDMHGNAEEFAVTSNGRAVIRGFCSGLPANLVRSASRSDPSEGEPAFSLANRGFRVAIVGHLKTKTPPLAVAPFDAKKAKEHQYAWAKHLGVDTEITNSIGMKLRLIPPGEFLMGSSPEQIARFEKIADEWARAGIRREGPQKKKTISEPFYLGAHEVTVGQFRAFVEATGYKTEDEVNGKGGKVYNKESKAERRPEYIWTNPAFSRSDRHPVVFVTPKDVGAFCAWLGEKEGRRYVLPTPQQWEFACRAGTTTAWFFGDDEKLVDDFCWFSAEYGGTTQPVGLKKANPFGLFDMHGNAEELVAPWPGIEEAFVRGGPVTMPAWTGRCGAGGRQPGSPSGPARGFRVGVVGELRKTEITKLPPTSKAVDEKLRGRWTIVAAEFWGKSISTAGVPSALSFADDRWQSIVKGAPFDGTLWIDPNKKEIEFKGAQPLGGEATYSQGIYAVEGDTLKLCLRAIGRPRPKEFSTADKSEYTYLFTFRRAKDAEKDFSPLFNGKDLAGWEGLPGLWTVDGQDVIGATSDPKGVPANTFLVSKKTVRNFEMRFQVRLKGEQGNSGVQIRSKLVNRERFTVHGPQVDIGKGVWSYLYHEGGGRFLAKAPADVVARTIKPLGFNEFYVRCVGKHVLVKFNGETTIDDDFPDLPDEGVLALQIHRDSPIEVTFRKMEIRELP